LSRILIFAEAVTLAHVARPIALSRIVRRLGHEVCIAASPAADRWLDAEGVARQRIASIDSGRFLRALARGMPPYSSATLKQYVEDDLVAIAAWRPDIVIGDFRLSLYISARLAGKPYGAVANAYWSRRYWNGVDAPPVPPLSWLPRSSAYAMFRLAYPAAFALHALPFHRICKAFEVEPPGLDLRDVYTASDVTAFADVEAFYERRPGSGGAPPFIGPLAWEPPNTQRLPPFPDGPPIVFVSLGSSGTAGSLPSVLQGLAGLPVRCIVASGASSFRFTMPANCVYTAQFVPYDEATQVAQLVVCNGGAPAVYAALAHDKPVLAIPANLDQVLNSRALGSGGDVRALRAGIPRPGLVRAAIVPMLRSVTTARSSLVGQPPIRFPDPSAAVTEWLRKLEEAAR
jgi:UDP:flavonoid glycosyltransferase YjiC (YdhE family)